MVYSINGKRRYRTGYLKIMLVTDEIVIAIALYVSKFDVYEIYDFIQRFFM